MKFLTEHLFKLGFVSEEDFCLFKIVHDVKSGVDEICRFYKVYHSSRWVRDKLVIRLSEPLPAAALANLNHKFADLVREGEIIQRSALSEEKNEPEILDMPRLVLTPYRRSFGRLRQLIDAINAGSIR